MATAWTVETQVALAGKLATNQAIDSANGNRFPNNGRVILVINGAASATGQVNVVGQRECGQGSVHNTQTPANAHDATTKHHVVGPFDQKIYNDSSGEVGVTYTGTVTGITVNIVELAAY